MLLFLSSFQQSGFRLSVKTSERSLLSFFFKCTLVRENRIPPTWKATVLKRIRNIRTILGDTLSVCIWGRQNVRMRWKSVWLKFTSCGFAEREKQFFVFVILFAELRWAMPVCTCTYRLECFLKGSYKSHESSRNFMPPCDFYRHHKMDNTISRRIEIANTSNQQRARANRNEHESERKKHEERRLNINNVENNVTVNLAPQRIWLHTIEVKR